ncbi:MAG: hypothetical protein IPK82_39760 [Polyangiaceae bacterium]|nr:hypothetical protein [Polyangiaceae bacterium]
MRSHLFSISFVSRVTSILATGFLALHTAACDGGDGSGGSGASGGTGGTGATGGTGGSGGAAECSPPPSEMPSTQMVNVTITNTSPEDRFLVTNCLNCDVIQVELKDDISYVPLSLWISPADLCGCECPAPTDPYAAAFHKIAAGESFTAVWDARALATCTSTMECGEGFSASVKTGALQPVGPGDYRVSFGVVHLLPPECTPDGSNGDYACTPPATPGLDLGGGFYPVEFALPPSGDLTLSLDVP